LPHHRLQEASRPATGPSSLFVKHYFDERRATKEATNKEATSDNKRPQARGEQEHEPRATAESTEHRAQRTPTQEHEHSKRRSGRAEEEEEEERTRRNL
jgi:hypothetical protein